MLSRPGCRLILARSLLTSKNTRVAGVIHAVTLRSCARHVSIGALRGAPLWYSRVPVGDVTCELYCRIRPFFVDKCRYNGGSCLHVQAHNQIFPSHLYNRSWFPLRIGGLSACIGNVIHSTYTTGTCACLIYTHKPQGPQARGQSTQACGINITYSMVVLYIGIIKVWGFFPPRNPPNINFLTNGSIG